MVDDYRTDDEQIEAIKNWWQENGRSTVVTVVLAIAGVFGWQQWQQGQQSNRENAASQYQELLDAVNQTEKTQSLLSTASHLAGELKENHASTTYAHFSALHMAKLSVEDNDLSSARENLQWILDNRAPDPAITSLARLRLARVVFAQSGAEEALSVINNVEAGVYKAAYAELRGDLLDELGELDKAEQQYSIAREGANATPGNSNALLDMKYKSVVRRIEANTDAASVADPAIEEVIEPTEAAENSTDDGSTQALEGASETETTSETEEG